MRRFAIESLANIPKCWIPRLDVRRTSFHSLSSSRFALPSVQQFQVPVGNNGHISLNVTYPALPERGQPNVVIHLPPGPVFQRDVSPQNHIHDTSLSSTGPENAAFGEGLASATSTVVTINYRLGAVPASEDEAQSQGFYRYPTPVHDTLAGFDWVLQNLQPARIGIIGTHVGGSLGLMLALTETQSIHAVAAIEPICDWTGLDEYCDRAEGQPLAQGSTATKKSRGRGRAPAPWDLVPLLEAREKFFTAPERYFDAFASPILFLRSAGKDVPKYIPRYRIGPDDRVPVLLRSQEYAGVIEDLDIYTPLGDIYDSSTADPDLDPDPGSAIEPGIENENRTIRHRKALYRWPPYGLDYGISGPSRLRPYNQGIKRLEMTLPRTQIFVRDHKNEHADSVTASDGKRPARRGAKTTQRRSVLTGQGNEMVDVMRRACFWGREKGFGESRVTLSHLGFQAGTGSGDEDAGRWLDDALMDDVSE